MTRPPHRGLNAATHGSSTATPSSSATDRRSPRTVRPGRNVLRSMSIVARGWCSRPGRRHHRTCGECLKAVLQGQYPLGQGRCSHTETSRGAVSTGLRRRAGMASASVSTSSKRWACSRVSQPAAGDRTPEPRRPSAAAHRRPPPLLAQRAEGPTPAPAARRPRSRAETCRPDAPARPGLSPPAAAPPG